MFVAFYADAYFSLGGEVLLYFIMHVEVIEIINLISILNGLEFRKDLKNKKPFLIFLLAMGRNPPRAAQPSLPQPLSCVAQERPRTGSSPTPHRIAE
jgi:hypothetical protein